ncbi:uncharacterized protein [Parasteatoda tepidariorum]|uniref:uncharacterized protein isoform X2 n=1 Tax=Parasteatoda tepidariorum TaxID=114398 RepID=UPI00077FB769|nr:uncharacterized protein LOC107446506 isoform X2 [Parasteatoda tepidariorum]
MDKMDKSKDINSKKVGVSKPVIKNNHLGIKSNAPRKFSYISRSKNPFDNKKYIYSDSKSFLKQSCDNCKSHLSLKPPHEENVEPSPDLNGNLSFNQHSTFCNFPPLSEVPNFGLSYQTQLSVQKTSKHRKSGYHEKRAFHSKTTSSKVPFHTNNFFSPVPHSSISYQNSKGNMPYVKFPLNKVCGDAAIVTEKYTRGFVTTQIIRDPFLQSHVRIANEDSYFAPSISIPDKYFTLQVDPDAQLRNLKSDYFVHNWQQISVSSLFENSADLKDADKIYPALTTNVQNEQMKSPDFSVRSDLECPNVVPATSSLGTNEMCVIPQTSYADVIHISTGGKISDSEKIFTDKKDEKSQTEWAQQDLNAIQATVVNLEKPSFYNSSLQKSISSTLSPPSEKYIKGDNLENVDKMSSSSSAYSSSFPLDSTTSMIDEPGSKPDSMYSSASSVSSSTNAFKPVEKKPVIIMDNCPDQITFGIEYDEMVKLCFDDCDPDNASTQESEKSACVKSECDEIKLVETSLEKELYWKESDVKYCEDNHIELTTYFASLWKECEWNPDAGSENREIKIYQER